MLLISFLAACGGGGGGDPSPAPASITTQPADTSVSAGSSAAFSVVASDATGYQWQLSVNGGSTWSDIAAATSTSYTVASATTGMIGYRYRVVVTGASNSVTSSAATLTVSTVTPILPTITVQPADASVNAGAAATFSVTASGTGLNYQWQSSPDGAAWSSLPGQTTASLSLPALAASASGTRYRVVVSNSAGTVNSVVVVLTVTPPPARPAISLQPVAQTVVAPDTATFSVSASGTPAPAYQWQLSTDGGSSYSAIAGATGATYTTPATSTPASGSRLRVVVSNSAGSVISDAALLTVNPARVAPAFTTQPASVSVTAPATATFTSSASGTPTPTYQWQVAAGGASFVNITGATSASYTTPATVAADSGKQYRVVASNSAGSSTSGTATLTVAAAVAVAPHRLSTTYGYSLAVKADGSVLSWGTNMTGGAGTAVPGTAASLVSGAASIAGVTGFADDIFNNYSIAIRSDGTVFGWGATSLTGMGLGVYDGGSSSSTLHFPAPTAIAQLGKMVEAKILYGGVTIARAGDGSIWLLGGSADVVKMTVAASKVPSLPVISSIGDSMSRFETGTVAGSMVPLLDTTGNVIMLSVSGLGDGLSGLAFAATYSARAVGGLPATSQVSCNGNSASNYHCLALSTDGTVWAWGPGNSNGELGDGTTVGKTIPFQVSGLTGIAQVASGISTSYAVSRSGAVYSWGSGIFSGLGRSGFGDSLTPAPVSGISNAAEIVTAGFTSLLSNMNANVLVRLSDGTVWGWGSNVHGELGTGTTGAVTLPTQAVGIHLN